MLSKTCNQNVYRLDIANRDYSCHLLQCNACPCTCHVNGCKVTFKSRCEMVLNCSRRDCKQTRVHTLDITGELCTEQNFNAIDCAQNCYAVKSEDNCFWCTKCLRGFCSSSNSYRSNFISSAPSTASQGLATPISTVQRKDNYHTWCE